jgi:hypothetical protein
MGEVAGAVAVVADAAAADLEAEEPAWVAAALDPEAVCRDRRAGCRGLRLRLAVRHLLAAPPRDRAGVRPGQVAELALAVRARAELAPVESIPAVLVQEKLALLGDRRRPD